MKIAYVILGCEKYIDRKKIQENTWLSKIEKGDGYYYLVGHNKSSVLKDNIFYLDCNDDYDSCPYKYLNFFREFSDYEKYDGFFFCDDDTYVFTNRLKSFIKKNNLDLFGRVGHTEKNRNSNSYCKYPVKFFGGGAGFFVNLRLFSILRKFLIEHKNIPMSVNSDVTMGHWLSAIGVDGNDIIDYSSFLKAQSPFHIENKTADIKNVITYHYCNADDFKHLYKISQEEAS